MIKNVIIIFFPILFLIGCVQNLVVDTLPNEVEDNFFISSNTRQIIPINDNTFIISTSIIAKNITLEMAKELAIIKACKIASDYYSKQSVDERLMTIYSSFYDGINLKNFNNLSKSVSEGIVTKKEILEETTNILGETIIQTIKIKIQLEKQPIKQSNIVLNANLNKSIFQNNETIKVCIETQKNVYLTILDIQPNNYVSTIYPLNDNNLMSTNEIRTFDKTISIDPKLLNNKEGIIKIFASNSPLNLSVEGNYKNSLSKLIYELLQLPQDQLLEINLIYEIK